MTKTLCDKGSKNWQEYWDVSKESLRKESVITNSRGLEPCHSEDSPCKLVAQERLASVIENYLDSFKANGLSQGTLKCYRIALNQFKGFCKSLELNRLDDLNEKHLTNFVLELKKSLKANTIRDKGLVVKNFLSYLTKEGLLSYDIGMSFPLVRQEKVLPKAIPTKEEYLKLINAIDTTVIQGFMDRVILELFYGTGMRMEELTALKTDSINLNRGEVHLCSSKTLKERIVPLPEIALNYLKAYLSHVRPKILNFSHSLSDLVFLSIRGTAIEDKKLNTRIKRYSSLAGIDKVLTSHSFRYAYATHLFENGADIRYISLLLGHKHLSMTARYILVSKKTLVDVLKKYHPRERGKR